MTDEDAAYYAKRLTANERKVLRACSVKLTRHYAGLADNLGITPSEAREAGQRLIAMNLATIKPSMMAGEFSGSGIFLNERGEQVQAKLKPR